MNDPSTRAECLRSKPDFVVYCPESDTGRDAENQHFLVVPTPAGTFLAVWTQATVENAPDQRVVVSRSLDRGRSWSPPIELDGQEGDNEHSASWGFPLVAGEIGRVYVFYNKNEGQLDVRRDTTGRLRFKYSDDDGRTWREGGELPIRRSAISHPDAGADPSWIVFQVPTLTTHGVIAGFTRWASSAVDPNRDLLRRDSEAWFLRFDNILTERDPARLSVTTLPDGEHGLCVPHPDEPRISVTQEPSVQELSDGRLIAVMRTLRGCQYYALSNDGGHTWSRPEPLRFREGGAVIPHPMSPGPLYRLGDGRFLLITHNNDGTAHGGAGPADWKRNRRPAYYCLGRETAGPGQPIAFDPPVLLADNDGVAAGPNGRTEIATYPSLFEHEGKVYFFYPDRKHFLLGRLLAV